MTTNVIMPKQGLQMTEGTIIKWLVPENGPCKQGQPLLEIETDKLTIEIDAPASGTLLKILRQEGETVPVAEQIAIIGEVGDQVEITPAPAAPTQQAAAPAANVVAASPDTAPAPRAQTTLPFKKRSATPRATLKARELGIDLSTVKGSGEDGIILERDILAQPTVAPASVPTLAASTPPVAQAVSTESGDKVVPLTGMRRTIATRMVESLQTNAQTELVISVDMTNAAKLREEYKQENIKVAYNDIFAYAVAKSMKQVPYMNSVFAGDSIILKASVNIGLAVALAEGLVVPVLKDVQKLSLAAIAQTSASLIEGAKNNSLPADAYQGGTFTISNLGMFGLDFFTAIINAPEAGILAVGKIEKRTVIIDDAIEIRPMTTLTLSFDHRRLDGAPAAQFLAALKKFMEAPNLML